MRFDILGAGVAGLATAIALRQTGCRVQVYERSPALRTMGAGIVAWPNAAWVMAQLGLGSLLIAKGHRIHQVRRMLHDGQRLGTSDIAALDHAAGAPSYAILRSDLLQSLYQRALALGVVVHWNHRVVSVDDLPPQSACAVQVRFANGSSLHSGALLGADGRMESPARRYVLGESRSAPVYQGVVNWLGSCALDAPHLEAGVVQDYWGTGTRFGIVPVAPGRVYWAAGATSAWGMARPTDYARELQSFATWNVSVARVLAATPLDTVHKVYLHDHDPQPRWNRGKVVLLGDAAHASLPTSGQGACQALEDAWHFAQCVQAHPGDVETAMQVFTDLRFQKTSAMTQAGRQLAQQIFFNATGPAAGTKSSTNDAAALVKFWMQGLPVPAPIAA